MTSPIQIFPNTGGTLPNDTLPIVTSDNVLAILPAYMRATDSAPIRDAIVAALTVMATTYEEAATYAASQRDVIYATGDNLDSLLNIPRRPGELDEDYRIRGLGFRDVVTPNAMCAAVNSLIAPLKCYYLEPALDQFFLQGVIDDGTDHTANTTWGCFFNVAAQYQDRFYPDDATFNNGLVKLNVNPGAAGLWDNTDGRMFALYIPDLAALNDSIALIWSGIKFDPSDLDVPEHGGANRPEQGQGQSLGGFGIYPMGFTGTISAKQFVYSSSVSETAKYNQIIDVVERIRGAGFQWTLLTQPLSL